MIHGLDTGFFVAAEVTEQADHEAARATLTQLVAPGDQVALAPQIWNRHPSFIAMDPSIRVGDQLMASLSAQQLPAGTPSETLEEKFQRLAATWHEAVAHHSSSRIRDNHPAYQEIISLGPAVVPLLLRDLETNRRHWFTALTVLTGTNPVPEADAGNIPKITAAWLRWGRENGYRW